MRNRLSFPDGGKQTVYCWDKYSLQNDGIYKWNSYDVIKTPLYHWKQYEIKESALRWKKYQVSEVQKYEWTKYPAINSADSNTYSWYKTTPGSGKLYFGLQYAYTTKSSNTSNTLSRGNRGWLRLFKIDGTYEDYHVEDFWQTMEEGGVINLLENGYIDYHQTYTYTNLWEQPRGHFLPGAILTKTGENLKFCHTVSGTKYRNYYTRTYGGSLQTITITAIRQDGTANLNNVVSWVELSDIVYPKNPNLKIAEIVSSTDINQYPVAGIQNGYLYLLVNSGKTLQGKLNFKEPDYSTIISQVWTSSNTSYKEGYQEEDNTFMTVKKVMKAYQGNYIETITATDPSAYPLNGVQDGYWYVFENYYPYYWDQYSYTPYYVWDRYDNDGYAFEEVYDYNNPKGYRYNVKAEVPFVIQGITVSGSPKNVDIEYDSLLIFWKDGSITEERYGYDDGYSDSPYDDDDHDYPNYSYLNNNLTRIIGFTPYSNYHVDWIAEKWRKQPKYLLTKNSSFTLNTPFYHDWDYQATYCLTYDGDITNYGYGLSSGYTLTTDVLSGQTILDKPIYNYKTTTDDGTIYTFDGVVYDSYYVPEGRVTEVRSTDPNAYPLNGIVFGDYSLYYYIRRPTPIYSNRRYEGQVSSYNIGDYPLDGEQNGKYYIYRYEDTSQIQKGQLLGTVNSYSSTAYPNDGIVGLYWYVFDRTETLLSRGNLISNSIESYDKNTYPYDGVLNDIWYSYTGYENNGPYKYKLIGEVENTSSNKYPRDGVSGNYWYVYKKSKMDYRLQINDDKLKGGITYKHNINPQEDYTVGNVASAEISFTYDNSDNDFSQYEDKKCEYYVWQPDDDDWRYIGTFYFDTIKKNKNNIDITAFDLIGYCCDKYIDELIAGWEYPTSIQDFYQGVCRYLSDKDGIDDILDDYDYRYFEIYDNFEAVNITGRQLLQYIAEMAGGYIIAENDTIKLSRYKYKNIYIGNESYTKATISEDQANIADGVVVKMNTDDVGVSYGDNQYNTYIIENNPLFYTEAPGYIIDVVKALYYEFISRGYYPAEIEMLEDFGINCGDYIYLNNNVFYVMEKEMNSKGCKLKCKGNPIRNVKATSINGDIVALRGKSNELYRDIETTRSTITDVAEGLQSQITQTASEINARVTNEVAGLESKITQTADSITSTVTDEINQAKSEIKQTTDSISLQVQNQGDLVAQLVLDVDGITAKGYVTFTDLSGSGKTTINGDNITTGTISADRINLTGAISWGDLTQSCKNTIASYAGSDADVPSYIHSTYISATEIRSPTIYGATIYAGLRDEGYCKMTASGLNVVSDTGGNICGIGWEPNYYNLPYLVLGSGVDDAGRDSGMIKKYTHGIWIGDNDSAGASEARWPTAGTGIFVDFQENKIYKYINGTKTAL